MKDQTIKLHGRGKKDLDSQRFLREKEVELMVSLCEEASGEFCSGEDVLERALFGNVISDIECFNKSELPDRSTKFKAECNKIKDKMLKLKSLQNKNYRFNCSNCKKEVDLKNFDCSKESCSEC